MKDDETQIPILTFVSTGAAGASTGGLGSLWDWKQEDRSQHVAQMLGRRVARGHLQGGTLSTRDLAASPVAGVLRGDVSLKYLTAEVDARACATDEYAGMPQLPNDYVCNVPPDQTCWYHYCTALQDAAGFALGTLPSGFVDAHVREAFDSIRALECKKRVVDMAAQRRDHATASRLSLPGPQGYGTDNEFKYASEILGGAIQTVDFSQPSSGQSRRI